jgi:NAD(P)-dependent dehydrogenase (short-subunit alcohol dehydrogenase family)
MEFVTYLKKICRIADVIPDFQEIFATNLLSLIHVYRILVKIMEPAV